MTDDTTVDAGSENSGETAAADTAQAGTTATDTSATDTAQATDASADAGDASSTVKAGDSCTCPDGRTGTVHGYDEGFICIPNADQG